jgi:probable O-glycosylation ligase (exosortase A-associated)
MLDLAFTAFFLFLLAAGLKRPFIWMLCYLYIDIVQPQVISWGLLSHLPVSLIAFMAAFLGWVMFDGQKQDTRFSFRQALLVLLLFYCGATTLTAAFPAEALVKWSWVWKAMLFAIFMPLTLRTRLRIEAAALVMVLAVSALIIDGGIKTAAGGSGYGALRIFIDSNYGLFEGSIISAVAVSIIPLIIWLARYGTVFPSDWRVWTFATALIFACSLIPVGTQARTGLICLAILAAFYLKASRHRILIGTGMAIALVIAVPFLPQSFLARMSTIQNHQADQSASTRIAMWKWTWEYAKQHPFGGGFDAYRSSKVTYDTYSAETSGSTTMVTAKPVEEEGRAYHSSYFEMLGEQGYPGFAMWILLQLTGLVQMQIIRRRWKDRTSPDEAWVAPLAHALQMSQIVYLVGSAFVAIAFQAFILMLIGLQCGLWTYLNRIDQASRKAAPGERRGMRARPVMQVAPTV